MLKLGQKIKFQKELIKDEYKRSSDTDQFYAKFPGSIANREKHMRKHGVKDNGKVMEGIMCGKRVIDMDGCPDEGYFQPGHKQIVYLIAVDVRGFHRVPEEFIIKD